LATKKKKKRAAKKLTKAQIQSRNQFFSLCLLTLGLLFFFLAVVEGSAGWLKLHNILLGLFGWSAFFIGPIFIYIAVMTSFDKVYQGIKSRAAMTGILLLVLCAFWQIFLAGQPLTSSPVEVIRVLYQDGIDLRGGGALSVLFGMPLMALGTPGDKIVAVLLLFLLVMIITRSTIAGVLRGAKKPVDRIVEVGHELSDSFAARQQERQKQKPLIDIPLDDGKPRRRKSSSPTADATAKSRSKVLTAAGANIPEVGKSDYFDKDSHKSEVAPIVPDVPIVEEEHQVHIDDIIARLAQKEKAQKESEAETAAAIEEKAADEASAEPMPKLEYVIPPITLLSEPKRSFGDANSAEELKQNAQLLVDTLQSFGVQTRIIDISRGPAVTRYELQPSAGVKISRITSLADDIALNLAAGGVRIEAPIPNKAAVGIEVPNRSVSAVTLREVIESTEFENDKSNVAVALGRDLAGKPVIADIAKMPHMLIAGATGSGKSVCINTIIMSILYRAKPEEVKFLMIDPKQVELGVYNGLPHLAVPVVNDPKKAAGALGWAVTEMLNRYKLLAAAGVRDITSYNRLAETQEDMKPLPQYVIIVDELADLMMAAPNEVEDYIKRLAQMARAAGMHLILATQRPSVDVITGDIKINIPSRIAFAVSSQIDSRTILDAGGAEKLLGKGDMLFCPAGVSKPNRVQGCFVSDEEIERVVNFIKSAGESTYDENLIAEIDKHVPAGKGSANGNAGGASAADEEDPMLMDAIECVVDAGLASTSLLQRKCKLGYARAARIIDELEARGIVGPFEGSKPRQVLISKERWLEMKLNRADAESNNQ